MNRNHLESPPPDAGGDRGGLIWIDQNISTPVTANYESPLSQRTPSVFPISLLNHGFIGFLG